MIKKSFAHPPPIANHFWYRHAVDDHSDVRHHVLSIEGTWVTQCCSNRVFAFLLSISDVYTFLAFRFFVWGQKERMKRQTFRKKLAQQLIYNPYLKLESVEALLRQSKRISQQHEHQLCTAPVFAKKYLGNGTWELGITKNLN